MLMSTVIGCTLAIWAIFHISFNYLVERTVWGKHLSGFCERHNIQVSFLQIRYFTTRLNRFLHKLVVYNVRPWFNAGVITSGILMIFSVFCLLYNLIWAFKEFTTPKVQGQPSKQVLRAIVPGVNFPIDQVGFLFVAIFFSGLFHEIGHAVAALREGGGMNGLGIFLCYVYPGAYVSLENIEEMKPRRRLRVYCAGVWHNFVLSILACLLIWFLPQLLFPFYSVEHDKVIVQSQSKMSPLAVDTGIQNGDIIKSIDNCSTIGEKEWFYCINQTIYQPQAGSCLNERAISLLSHLQPTSDPQNCCRDGPERSICYKHVGKSREYLYSCMNARTVMANEVCYRNNQCKADEICVKPYQSDGQRLMRITVERDSTTHSIIYLGLPHDLYYFITITQYQPRTKWFPYTLPASILHQLQFFFAISTALGMLNIIPCYRLDGEYAFLSFFDELWGENHKRRKLVCNIVLSMGTALVMANTVGGLVQAFR